MKSVKSAIQTLDSATIHTIAFGDTSIAAYQAKAILELINDTLYPYPFEVLDTSGGSSKNQPAGLTAQGKSTDAADAVNYRLIPTLIKGQMVGFVRLGENETGELELFNLRG